MEKYKICKVVGSNLTSISAVFSILIDWKGNFKKSYYKILENLRVNFIYYFVHFGRQFEAFLNLIFFLMTKWAKHVNGLVNFDHRLNPN
jgi:hypothetical protein